MTPSATQSTILFKVSVSFCIVVPRASFCATRTSKLFIKGGDIYLVSVFNEIETSHRRLIDRIDTEIQRAINDMYVMREREMNIMEYISNSSRLLELSTRYGT